ncbi:MAG: hypothetical protein HYX82_03590, partial [Chloroflexi bacterium]|nr:hypothetical protein [Chloroflexota bacterium]
HAFNWDARDPTNLSLNDGQRLTGKAVVGGIAHKTTLLRGLPKDATVELESAREETRGRGWIAGPGCTVPPDAPVENLRALGRTTRN